MHQALSLTEFEAAFQNLQSQLNLHISKRLKSRLLGEFCILLAARRNPVLNHSYFEQLLPYFVEHLSEESLIYQPIKIVAALYGTLKYTRSQPDFDTSSEAFRMCLDTVKKQCVLSHVYLYEFAASIRIALEDEHPEVDLRAFESVTDIGAMFAEAEAQGVSPDILSMYAGIRDGILEQTTGFGQNQVWIPLVEKFEDYEGNVKIMGTIYPLELDFEARTDNRSRDIITFNNHPIDQDDLVNYQAQDALIAARNEHAFLSSRATRRYTVSFGFPSSAYSYSGSSFGLGMALLSLSNLERESNLRRQARISRAYAITGGIDLKGNIRNVNARGLREKISAAFHSPLRGILLPEENAEDAREVLAELQAEHPNRKFQIIAERTLPSILDNQRILRYEHIPFHVWSKNHITRFRVIQTVVIITVVLALILVGTFLNADSNPAEFKIAGEEVLFFNNNGKFLWKLDLDHHPDYLKSKSMDEPAYRFLQIHDFDEDGENEVVLGTNIRQHGMNGQVFFIETDGTIKWKYAEHPKLVYGSEEYTDNYRVNFIHHYHHPGTDHDDIFVSFAHQPWFPSRLVRFNLDGEVMDEFIHPGALYDMEFRDLNHDGDAELIIGYTSNAFNDAAVAVLPSRGFYGTVPQWEGTRSLEGGVVDPDLVYLKFPNWGIYDFLEINTRSHVHDIFLDSDESFIVTVSAGGLTTYGSYIYSFDLDLNLKSVSVSDGLLSQYHKHFGRDFFEAFDRGEWEQAVSQIDIWRDGKWSRMGIKR